jgi:hypothetical protein
MKAQHRPMCVTTASPQLKASESLRAWREFGRNRRDPTD